MMKKWMFRWIALILMLSLTSVCGEQDSSFFAQFEGMEWSFSSGAGGWSTDMRFSPEGSFTGEYHDSEMGETGDLYPEGTIYSCSFTGRMSFVEQVNEFTWKVRVEELETGETPDKEWIDDGIRFVAADPYGITAGDELLVYCPGTPVSVFTEEMQLWAHLLDTEDTLFELDNWFLWNEKQESGFVGYLPYPGMSVANP